MSEFGNYATVVGEVERVNWNGDRGKNGQGNITVNAGGDKVRVTMWGNDDGSNKRFIQGIEEGTEKMVQGNLDYNKYEGNTYISVKAFSQNSFRTPDVEEKAVAVLKGDLIKCEPKYDAQGNQEGEIIIAIFNDYAGKGKDNLSRAEVLMNEIQNHKEYLKENTDKDTGVFDKLISSLNEDSSKKNIYKIINDLEANTNMRFWNIDFITAKMNDQVAEAIIDNEVEEYDLVKVGVRIVNRMVKDVFGDVTGSEQGIVAKKFYVDDYLEDNKTNDSFPPKDENESDDGWGDY